MGRPCSSCDSEMMSVERRAPPTKSCPARIFRSRPRQIWGMVSLRSAEEGLMGAVYAVLFEGVSFGILLQWWRCSLKCLCVWRVNLVCKSVRGLNLRGGVVLKYNLEGG